MTFPKWISKTSQTMVLISLSALMMGNQKCEEPNRNLRRRVQMGTIDAPAIPLPNGGKFDFKFVANAQMYDVLRKTQSFSTSTVSGGQLDLDEMTQADRDAFNRCEDPLDFQSSVFSKVATCMVNMPQAVISGDIVNFELTTAGGLTIGIPSFGGLEAAIDVKKAVLTMAMTAYDPLIPGHVKAATTQRANRFETDLNFSFNVGGFEVGPRAYFKSDLSKVVAQAMENSVNDLKQQFDQAEPWFAMVMKNCDKAIIINGGSASDVGLQVGDILEVHNVWYNWEGEACNSKLLSSMQSSPMGKPVAVAQVEIVGDTMSQARVIEQTGEKIQPGARVYIRKLAEPAGQKSLAARQTKP